MDAALLSGMSKLQTPPAFRVMPDRLEHNFVPDTVLQDALEEALLEATPDLTAHAWAIVDLSDNLLQPRYAAYNDTLQKPIGSLAKLLPLYGAFELRHNLSAALLDFGAPDLNTLAQRARSNLASVKGSSGSRPLIEKLFVLSPDGSDLDFPFGVNGTAPQRYDDQLLALVNSLIPTRIGRTTRPNPEPGKLPLSRLDDDTILANELTDARTQGRAPTEDQLRLMAGWSDNVSAAIITRALGFDYLWALANRSGLYRRSWEPLTRNDFKAAGAGGLCLTSDYNYGRWHKRPAGVPGSPSQGGSARSIALLMSKLALGVLVDSRSSFAMREMMRKSGPGGLAGPPAYRGETSPLGKGMLQAGWSAGQHEWAYDGSTTLPPDEPMAVSKVGYTETESMSNALIVRTKRDRTAGGQKMITMVLVGINWMDDSEAPLIEFAKRMAAALEAKHGLVKNPGP
jgi:Beta-lactamase enzyme family